MRNPPTVQLRLQPSHVLASHVLEQSRVGLTPSLGLALSRGTSSRGAFRAEASSSGSQRRFPRRASLPLQPGFSLSPATDSGVLGDGKTTLATVELMGLTSPNARVTLQNLGQNTGLTTLADAAGKFLFTDIPLALGITPFTATATQAGRSRSFTAGLERLATDQTDAVLSWNATALSTIQLERSGGLAAARSLAIAHTAMFDAANVLIGNAQSYRPLPVAVPPIASAPAAVAGAAHQVLSQLYPQQTARLDAALTASLASIQESAAAKTAGVELGRAIATNLLTERSRDGATVTLPYRVKLQPGQWRPTPPRLIPAAAVGWRQVTPFVLNQGAQFRPVAPPLLTSRTYAKDLNQVKRLGQLTGHRRTAQQTEISRFWLGNPGTLTFPGMWNQIAAQAALNTEQTLWQNARLLASLNVALMDASIAAWDAKYTYRRWRPITAIRQAKADGNPATQADPTWQSFLETPAHPDYVSSHSTFAGAATAVLNQTFGPSDAFTVTSLDRPGIERAFNRFEQAAAEAGMSRIYGGIHTQTANRVGLELGRKVGRYVLQQVF